jgi:DNA-binding PadR family transcriptional regulator
MPPVFAHGRLRLYLLKLLDEAPRHGYEVIRLLEERFQGLYAPSAGTVYPRLAKLEAESLVSHTTEGGRKVYSITDTGRAELADRQGELAELELEIHESLAALAAGIREDVRGSADDLRREMREAAQRTRSDDGSSRTEGAWDGQDSWQQAKEELRRAKQAWKEQARRAKEESRKAEEEARRAEEGAQQARQEAQEEVRRIARQVQEQVRSRAQAGDWQGAVREGMAQLSKEMGTLGRITGHTTARPPYTRTEREPEEPDQPAQPHEDESVAPSEDPARDLERLLDRFRDDIRDAARDHGVTDDQLREVRRHLSAAAAHIGAVLRSPKP